jgi:hypothetical protein
MNSLKKKLETNLNARLKTRKDEHAVMMQRFRNVQSGLKNKHVLKANELESTYIRHKRTPRNPTGSIKDSQLESAGMFDRSSRFSRTARSFFETERSRSHSREKQPRHDMTISSLERATDPINMPVEKSLAKKDNGFSPNRV